MKTAGLVHAVVLGVSAIAFSACTTGYAYGQPPYRDGRPYYDARYYREIEQRAYDNGFREGLRQGQHDGRDNRRYDPQRHSEWKHADDGFRREYGDPNLYRRNFRSGFEAGYSQSFRSYTYDRGYYRR
jgi:hypothetical protein